MCDPTHEETISGLIVGSLQLWSEQRCPFELVTAKRQMCDITTGAPKLLHSKTWEINLAANYGVCSIVDTIIGKYVSV